MRHAQKSYPAPWQSQIILACRKCQKKLKGDQDRRELAQLRKTCKRHNKKHPDQALHIINVPCLDLCPKDGVTICNPAQRPVRLMILRNEDDLKAMFTLQEAEPGRRAGVSDQECGWNRL
jgi:predicted metal-binding protein